VRDIYPFSSSMSSNEDRLTKAPLARQAG
jgi:hypothetical protein